MTDYQLAIMYYQLVTIDGEVCHQGLIEEEMEEDFWLFLEVINRHLYLACPVGKYQRYSSLKPLSMLCGLKI